MTRYAIDAGVAVRLLREGVAVRDRHQLVGPNLLRSQALSILFRAVRSGELTADEGRALLEGLAALKIRLLGDRVSRAVAWKLADQLGWDDTARAEYVAVAQLQADAFVTLDEQLARAVYGLVPLASFEALISD